MGLLDEAIREHLELKRRRGGDASTIAREEREALAPGVADVPEDDGNDAADRGAPDAEIALATAPTPMTSGDQGEERFANLAAGGQETAELDMQQLMAVDPDAADPGSPEPPAVDELAPAGTREDDAPNDESVEWELPGDRDSEAVPEEIPGQERLSFE